MGPRSLPLLLPEEVTVDAFHGIRALAGNAEFVIDNHLGELFRY
jgi:hypothetical protein